MRHFLKFLPEEERDDAEQKYIGQAKPSIPLPKERRKTPRLTDRKLSTKGDPAVTSDVHLGDATGEWRVANRPSYNGNGVSSATGQFLSFLDDADISLEDTDTFDPQVTSQFDPYGRS